MSAEGPEDETSLHDVAVGLRPPVIGPGHDLRHGHRQDRRTSCSTRPTPWAGCGGFMIAVRADHAAADRGDATCSLRGVGIWGINIPGRLGLRHRQLRLVDRYRPRRNADLRHSAAAQAELAQLRSTASPKP